MRDKQTKWKGVGAATAGPITHPRRRAVAQQTARQAACSVERGREGGRESFQPRVKREKKHFCFTSAPSAQKWRQPGEQKPI